MRALCHELGNLLAAVRLTAHLLESESKAAERRDLARDQQRLVAHSAALLGLFRPLTDPAAVTASALSTASLLSAVERTVDDCLPGGFRLRVAKGTRLPDVRADSDAVHHLLVAFVAAGIDAAAPSGCVTVRASEEGRRIVFQVRDDGPRGEAQDGPAARGRPLLVAIGDEMLRPLDGSARLLPSRRGTKVAISL
nr:hypothetical protein [Myxococcota bacterium]